MVAEEPGLTRHTIYGIAQNTLKEYPKEAIEALCTYFDCDIGDLLSVVEITE